MSCSACEQVRETLQNLPEPTEGRRRLLVTGGPTCEDIDAVRFITNRSSGRTGIEITRAAGLRGWPTLLILGPTHLAPPDECACIRVRSATEMAEAVDAAFPWCDALIMSAAVADYTPVEPQEGKLKKDDGDLLLRLKRTPDILAAVGKHPNRPGKCLIGFALDTTVSLVEGKRKLEVKNLDAIIVNSTASFAGESTSPVLLRRDGSTVDLGTLTKGDLAVRLLDEVSLHLS